DPDYLATTPEAWRGLPGPACIRGQTNPRAAGTCFVIRNDSAAGGSSGGSTGGSTGGAAGGQPSAEGSDGTEPAPPPPPPPTAAEVLARCPTPPAPKIGVNPAQR